MFGKKETFRRAALERLSSPERLDEMMRSTPPKGWLALTALGVLLTLALLWGFFGSLPNEVSGPGILIPGRTRSVDAPTGGVITRLQVKVGDTVESGTPVAVLTDPDAAEELQSLQRELDQLIADDAKAQQEEEFARTQRENTYAINERTFATQIQLHQKTRQEAAARLATFADQNLYGEQDRAPWRARLLDAENQINSLLAQIESNRKARQEEDNARQAERRRRRQKIEAKESEIALKRLAQGQVLKATHPGRVFDVLADEGSTVTPGRMLVRIEDFEQELQAFAYVPSRAGQTVRLGHPAQVSPSNVKKEEYGTIRGEVIDKNDYPMNKQGIINDIRNETLAEEYVAQGAPIRLVIRLLRNEQALRADPELSGYQWTSGNGPKRKILSGTPCQVTVTTGYSRPIDVGITWLRSTVGL